MIRTLFLVGLLCMAFAGCGRSARIEGGEAPIVNDPETCSIQFSKTSIVLGETVAIRVMTNNVAVQATLQNGTVVTSAGVTLSPTQTTTYTANTGAATCTGTVTVASPTPTPTAVVNNPCIGNPMPPSCQILVSPTADKTITVSLNYICSTATTRSYIEDSTVTTPILTFETNVANLTARASRAKTSLAQYRIPNTRFLRKDTKTASKRLEIAVSLDVDPLRQWYANLKLPSSLWQSDFVGVLVGDDKDKDWSLIDDVAANKKNLLNGNIAGTLPGFLAKAPPARMVIDIFQGKGITKTSPNFAKYCHSQASPLVLDLHGDGFKLSNAQPGSANYDEVLFDIDGDSVKERVGWVAAGDDVLLARDRNFNGRIDSGRELFGNHTLLQGGAEALNGFEALRELDSDGDGKISRSDRYWDELKVWIDGHTSVGKGVSHPSELKSLDEVGVESISLEYVQIAESDGYNQTRQRAVFQHRMDNRIFTKQIADIWFEVGE